MTKFDVNATNVAKFDRNIVSGREDEELWVPAEELQEFNRQIVGSIVVTYRFAADEHWLSGRWQRQIGEAQETYVARLTEFGDMPHEIKKALRVNFGIGLAEAQALVVTDREIDIFLRANKERGLSQFGAVRLMAHVFGMLKEDARFRADRSGLWRHLE